MGVGKDATGELSLLWPRAPQEAAELAGVPQPPAAGEARPGAPTRLPGLFRSTAFREQQSRH